MEIRLLIWEYALPGPRIVFLEPRVKSTKFRYCYRVRSDVHIDDNQFFFDGFMDGIDEGDLRVLKERNEIGPMEGNFDDTFFHSRCPPPVILEVCRESYRVATRFYRKAFGTSSGFPEIWFNYDVDTLFLDFGHGTLGKGYYPQYRLSSFGVEDRKRVRYLLLAENEHILSDDEYYQPEDWVAQILLHFTGVKKITRSVFGDYYCEHQGDEIVLKEPVSLEILQHWMDKDFNPTDDGAFLSCVRDGCFRGFQLDLVKLKRRVERAAEISARSCGIAVTQYAITLPEIDYKLAASPAFKAQLDAAEAKYWEEFEPPKPLLPGPNA